MVIGSEVLVKANVRHRMTVLLPLLTFALAGCTRHEKPPEMTRPDWSHALVDGIAPLLSPEQVKRALDHFGYRQFACQLEGKMNAQALFSGDEMVCYRSQARQMRVLLHFVDLREGRRLEDAYFHTDARTSSSDYDVHNGRTELEVRGKATVQQLHQRFGKPMTVSRGYGFDTYYWRMPGGIPDLPDTISTTVNNLDGPSIDLQSMWAGRVRSRESEHP
jgi:hypothetical protein